VRFFDLFVKLALQTNQKLGLKSMQWVLLVELTFSILLGSSPIGYKSKMTPFGLRFYKTNHQIMSNS
jgi:hypothetical protein